MDGARARRPRGWIALPCVALLAGGAALDGAGTTSGAVPQQLQDRQIIVTLASAPSELAEGMRGTLARSHGLHEVGTFPLLSIGVQCVVFQVSDDRSIEDVIARLRRDPLVKSVQAKQVGQLVVSRSMRQRRVIPARSGAVRIASPRAPGWSASSTSERCALEAAAPAAGARLEVDDVLVESMRGRSKTWTLIRVSPRHVPEAERPAEGAPDPDSDPWRRPDGGRPL